MIYKYKCKYCPLKFPDKKEAEKHGIICGMSFEIVKVNK